MRSEPPTIADLFHCTQCGECCKGFGGTYVTETDIRAIGGFLGIAPHVVRRRYCTLSGAKPLLAQADSGYCVFWDGNCTIHPVKPRMCRQWPFIPSVLVDAVNWRIMAGCCPGMRKDVANTTLRVVVGAALQDGRP